MSVMSGLNQDDTPGSFAVLTWRVTDSDDHKSSFVSIITLDQGKCPLGEQALAGLILNLVHLTPIWFADGKTIPIGKNRAVHSPRGLRDIVYLLWNV